MCEKAVREGWEELAANDAMQQRYGENPLSQLRRVPDAWCRDFGICSKRAGIKRALHGLDDIVSKKVRKRGRSIKDKYPMQLLACQDRLSQVYNEARNRNGRGAETSGRRSGN